jgi:hypothetical protein
LAFKSVYLHELAQPVADFGLAEVSGEGRHPVG